MQEIFFSKSAKISFAFTHGCITIRAQKFQFVVTFRIQAHVRKLRGNVRRRKTGNSGQNAESENAMSRGTLELEWQYTLGLITWNYRLLNLDIRHMCAFNQSSSPSQAQPALSIPGFNSQAVLPSELRTTHCSYEHLSLQLWGCYSIPRKQWNEDCVSPLTAISGCVSSIGVSGKRSLELFEKIREENPAYNFLWENGKIWKAGYLNRLHRRRKTCITEFADVKFISTPRVSALFYHAVLARWKRPLREIKAEIRAAREVVKIVSWLELLSSLIRYRISTDKPL